MVKKRLLGQRRSEDLGPGWGDRQDQIAAWQEAQPGIGCRDHSGGPSSLTPMVEFGFYHLTRSALEQALGRLLEKVLASGQRAVVVASSAERVEALNRALWTFGRDSFLPHGSREDGFAEDQPVFLTHEPDYPHGASVLVLVDGAALEPPDQFTRCLYLFDGNDPAAVAQARDFWRQWRERGATLTYWQQTERGGWQKATPTSG
jgi:DNA polymerase-3 subunit chi